MARDNLKFFLILRTSLALLSYSWHNADETWQSVEVAHKIVFGRGYLTWEWTNEVVGPIRSCLHPMMFVPIMYILKLIQLDFHWMIALAPRIQQGIITAFGDYYITKFYNLNFGKTSQKWFVFLYSTNVYLLYCGSRTLVNTLEMNLTCFALYHYSKTIDHRYTKYKTINVAKTYSSTSPFNCLREDEWINELAYVIIISASFVIRPTTAIFWIPLVFYHVILLARQRAIVSILLLRLVPCAGFILMLSSGIDSVIHGKFVFVPWNFFRINFLQDVSVQYGNEPWFYYLTHTLLPLLNISSIFVIGAVKNIGNRKSFTNIYLISTVWTISLLSCLAHKEQRFLLPVFPLLLCYGADFLHRMELREKYKNTLTAFIIICNILPVSYLLFGHKVGQTSVVANLAKDFMANRNDQHYHTNVLFLLPCHSTPFYSHFHLDYPLDFLKCPPVLDSNWKDYAEGKDESDFFFDNPNKWIEKELLTSSESRKLPSHIVIYDMQANLTLFKKFANENNFVKCFDVFNTLFSESKKVGKRIFVYCRKMK